MELFDQAQHPKTERLITDKPLLLGPASFGATAHATYKQHLNIVSGGLAINW